MKGAVLAPPCDFVDTTSVRKIVEMSRLALHGDHAPLGLSFIDTFVKCPAGLLAVTAAALLPSWIAGNKAGK